MQKLHSHFKSLSLILLCITATTQGMESKNNNKLAPTTFAQIYLRLSNFLLPELARLIFSLQFDTSDIDYKNLPTLIKDSCKHPYSFVETVSTLLKLGNDTLVTEILECGLTHANVSIFDIKTEYNWTILHNAAYSNNPKTIKIILPMAGDKTWEFLHTKSIEGNTALHIAAINNKLDAAKLFINAAGNNAWTPMIQLNYLGTALHCAAYNGNIEIIRFLLDTAGERAQELMAIRNHEGKTAFDVATPQAQEIMDQYNEIEDTRYWRLLASQHPLF